MRGVMALGQLARANAHWTDEEWISRALGEYEGRDVRRVVWGGLALAVLGFWLTVGLLLL